MIELGKKQVLYVVKKTPIGIFLNVDPDELLNSMTLPKEEIESLGGFDAFELGQEVEAYVYKNLNKQMVATTVPPLVELGEVGLLECVESNHYGAFLHWGYDKDVLLPFNEQFDPVKKGHKVMVGIYLDKSGRLCATQKLRKFLVTGGDYQVGDAVEGVIYDMNDELGAFVAIDKKYFGLILSNEVMPSMRVGQSVSGRITKIRDDGKMNMTVNKRIDLQMDDDASYIYNALIENEGFLPYHDKTDADTIKRALNMSKKAFKRSIGKLYKDKKIRIDSDGIHKED